MEKKGSKEDIERTWNINLFILKNVENISFCLSLDEWDETGLRRNNGEVKTIWQWQSDKFSNLIHMCVE